MIEVTESRSEIVYEALPTDDPQQRQPDIGRARDLLGWEPQVELLDGLRRTIDQAGVERLVGASTIHASPLLLVVGAEKEASSGATFAKPQRQPGSRSSRQTGAAALEQSATCSILTPLPPASRRPNPI